MKISTTSERLKEYMHIHRLRQVDIIEMVKPFCADLDVKFNKSDLSQYVSGKTEPGQDKLVILSKALKVSEPWLMGYDVPPEREDKPQPTPEPDCRCMQRRILRNIYIQSSTAAMNTLACG